MHPDIMKGWLQRSYYICLNGDHPPFWSSSLNPNDRCQYCNQPRPITYYYLSLRDKIERWCADKEFCIKMTAHWRDRSKWLNSSSASNNIRNEIWDGTRYVAKLRTRTTYSINFIVVCRFAELAWFWDPQQKWLLPCRCDVCKLVISSEVIAESVSQQEESSLGCITSVVVKCPNCYTRIMHVAIHGT